VATATLHLRLRHGAQRIDVHRGAADGRARAQIGPAQAAGLLRWHGFVPNDQAMPMLDGALAGLSLLHDELLILWQTRHGVPVLLPHTLLMNPGDVIRLSLFNAKIPGGHALEARETDFTTGQSGFMIASAANGFMNTNPADCSGSPFNFQPEYSSARAQNIIPWGIGPYMINDQYELGHFEPCTSVTGSASLTEGTFTDTYFLNCHGPYEKGKEDPNLETDDSPCFKFGDTHGGTAAPNLVTGCDVFFDTVGDLDWDGTPYYPDWPDSVIPDRFPSPFLQLQPTTVGGHRYPQIQFMTDTSASEINTNCDLNSGAGCVLPPQGPGHFFPYFTQARVGGLCLWEFGNMRNGNTFGGDAQYGAVGPGTLGAFAGPVRSNPNC
jgi:hypothetical protein